MEPDAITRRLTRMAYLTVTVIIPTKNRPSDLQRAVRSLLLQTVLPQSLVVIDQSDSTESQRLTRAELAEGASARTGPELRYIYDVSIRSAARARNRGMQVADGDIWLFLDDDVVLEPQFIEALSAAYREHPDAAGISGIITNYGRPRIGYRLWDWAFMRGPFRDQRQPIYWRAEKLRNSPPIRVDRFTGAVMSFRAEVVRKVLFDEELLGVSDGEDVDFCLQLGPSARLLIAPRARLAHCHSPAGRLQDHWLRRMVRGNVFLYRKNWSHGIANRICYVWFMLGCGLVGAVGSARRMSLDPYRALLVGLGEARRAVPG